MKYALLTLIVLGVLLLIGGHAQHRVDCANPYTEQPEGCD